MEMLDIYAEAAKHYNITIEELRRRLTQGEPLIQKFYEAKYKWDPSDDSTIFF